MGALHGVRRLPGGALRVRLSTREHQLLRALPDQLRPLLSGEQDAGAVSRRLYPPAYDDDALEAEYRDLAGSDLVDQRVGAVDVFARSLEAGDQRRLTWSVRLDADTADAWLSALNDARLVLGSVLAITEESQWEQGPRGDDPSSVLLYYLGWLQEELLAALMADPGGPDGVPGESPAVWPG